MGVPDVFASDLTRVEILGQNVRFILHVEQSADDGAPKENVVVAKIVMPLAVIPSAIQRVLFAIGHRAVENLCRAPMRLS